jgi:hypothetical protein
MTETGNIIKAKADAISALADALSTAIESGEIENLKQVQGYLKAWTAATFEMVPVKAYDFQQKTMTLRVWNEGDPEPEVGAVVRDRDGDIRWHVSADMIGWTSGYPTNQAHLTWQDVLQYAPLVEVIG